MFGDPLYMQLEDQQVAPPTLSSFWRQDCLLTNAFVLLVPFLNQTNTAIENTQNVLKQLKEKF